MLLAAVFIPDVGQGYYTSNRDSLRAKKLPLCPRVHHPVSALLNRQLNDVATISCDELMLLMMMEEEEESYLSSGCGGSFNHPLGAPSNKHFLL